MASTLKEEFEQRQRWEKLIPIALLAFVLAALGAYAYWPPNTLWDALKKAEPNKLRQIFQGVPLTGEAYSSWNWVDGGRRSEMIAGRSGPFLAAAETMLQAAKGRRFLFHPLGLQALVNTGNGPLFILRLPAHSYDAIARDQQGGPLLDLKDYWVSSDAVAIPAATLAHYATLESHVADDKFWRFFLEWTPRNGVSHDRTSITLFDPLTAMTASKVRG
jgi:hypothetical protein